MLFGLSLEYSFIEDFDGNLLFGDSIHSPVDSAELSSSSKFLEDVIFIDFRLGEIFFSILIILISELKMSCVGLLCLHWFLYSFLILINMIGQSII